MKTTILTIILTFIVSVGMAQTKPDTDIYEKHFQLFKKYLKLKDSVSQLNKDVQHYYGYYTKWQALTDSISHGEYVKPMTWGLTSISNIIVNPCRDTTIKHKEKVVIMTVLNFDKNTFIWQSGYRLWDETKSISGSCMFSMVFYIQKFTFTNLKGVEIKNIIDYRLLKP